MRRIATLALLAIPLVLACFAVAEADPITSFGRPVTAIGSSSAAVPDCPTLEGQSCFDTTTGNVTFFIPVSTAKSGVFGVTNVGGGVTAGTKADTGGGTESIDALTMYLMFTPVAVPALSASLEFDFFDLDLSGVNDPYQFLESIEFYDADGAALTDRITVVGQAPGSSALDFVVTGNSTSQSILFPDITALVEDPFFIEARFRTSYPGTGTNTSESMIATLISDPVPPQPTQIVPEPGALALLALGLGALAAARGTASTRGNRT